MTEIHETLAFPDGPRSDLDHALSELIGSAQKVMETQGRLRSLLDANKAFVGQRDLPSVLRQIVEAAVELVGGRYGALGVIAPDGSLEQFIHVGMTPVEVARIGHLPEGKGVLGALIEDPRPIRLEHLADDPRSAGFPSAHPPMDSFLGVPIRIREEVYGNLYLSEHRADSFSAEDSELLTALAATAGVAIDNARLFQDSQRRELWASASAEMSAALVSEDTERPLHLLAERVNTLTGADLACVVIPSSEGRLSVAIASGALAESVTGTIFKTQGSLAGRALESGQPILAASNESDDPQRAGLPALGPTMVAPLIAADGVPGVLIVSRAVGAKQFTSDDVDRSADLAAQASVAFELARGAIDRQKLALLEDRSRIARDLHDHVIQRLFAAGLGLQAVASTVDDTSAREKINGQIDTLDAAIAEIRTAIFALSNTRRADRPSIRHRVVDLIAELDAAFPVAPHVVFAGPVDLHTPEEMADDLIAVVREALTNVARHAAATETVVRVAADDRMVSVEIADNGVGGAGRSGRRSGIANLERRAAAWDGECSTTDRDSGGTLLRWTARIPVEQRT